MYKGDTSTHAQGIDPRVAVGAEGELPRIYLGAWGGESTPRPYGPVCRWGRRGVRGVVLRAVVCGVDLVVCFSSYSHTGNLSPNSPPRFLPYVGVTPLTTDIPVRNRP